ncbi:LysE family translocator [Pseudomonas sp. NPDC078416]|uniref:LysE family translocator n=1 Tax=Pseudomonas sp. NPDC078416 TaxID=3390637 RepID=UPI003CFEDA83
MVNWPAVTAVFSVYCAGVIIPGPNFVAVAHKAVSATTAHALMLVAGIVVVNLFWATCAILGIGAVFSLLPWLAFVVKCLGAGYLVWFGMRLIFASGKPPTLNARAGQMPSLRSAFKQGVATNIANPKSVAFYAAIFSAAAPSHVEFETLAAMLAMVGLVSSAWYALIATALSRPRIAGAYASKKKAIDRVCGAVIVMLGVRQMSR